jgi:apolipoprotein N-acyltransferase
MQIVKGLIWTALLVIGYMLFFNSQPETPAVQASTTSTQTQVNQAVGQPEEAARTSYKASINQTRQVVNKINVSHQEANEQ